MKRSNIMRFFICFACSTYMYALGGYGPVYELFRRGGWCYNEFVFPALPCLLVNLHSSGIQNDQTSIL